MKLSLAHIPVTLALLLAVTPAQAQDIAPNAQPAAEAPAAPTPAPEAQAAPVAPAYRTDSLLPAAAADGCELHIWPAERMTSVTTGLLGGGLIDAMLHSGRDATNKTLLASALDSPSQLDALLSLDLRTLLQRTPGTKITIHESPIERKTMNKVKVRRSESTAQCYSELIVADVFYQKAAIYGRSLKTLFMLRDFGNDLKIDKEYKAWGGNGLKLFPPKEGEDAVAALDELVTTFKKNFDEYAGNARRSLASKSRR